MNTKKVEELVSEIKTFRAELINNPNITQGEQLQLIVWYDTLLNAITEDEKESA